MLNEALEALILKLFEEDHLDYDFQQDNAPSYKAKQIMEWFANNDVRLFLWPPQSPDVSLIENLRTISKEKVSTYKCKCKEELKEKFLKQSRRIPVDLCKKRADSMSKREHAVIKARGVP